MSKKGTRRQSRHLKKEFINVSVFDKSPSEVWEGYKSECTESGCRLVSQCSGPTWYSEKIVMQWPHILIFTAVNDALGTGKSLSEMPRIIECDSKTLHLRACAFGDGVHFNGCILTGNILVFYDGMASGEKKLLRYTIEKVMEATANMNISLFIY